jgi:hypothetical protein
LRVSRQITHIPILGGEEEVMMMMGVKGGTGNGEDGWGTTPGWNLYNVLRAFEPCDPDTGSEG